MVARMGVTPEATSMSHEAGRTSPKRLSKRWRPKIAKRTSLSLFVSGSLILGRTVVRRIRRRQAERRSLFYGSRNLRQSASAPGGA